MSLARRPGLSGASATFILASLLGGCHGYDWVLQPQPIQLEAGEHGEFIITGAALNCSAVNARNLTVLCLTSDKRVLDCASDSFVASESCGFNGSLLLHGVAIGIAQLRLLSSDNDSLLTYDASVVRRKATVVDGVFTYGVIVLLSLGTMGFGASLDLQIVRERLRRPKSLLVGLACQFTLMPAIAFALCRMVSLPTPLALGVFASGCAPSGGASNLWSKLLGGDVDLSIVLTFLTNIVAFGIMPLWIYTLGPVVSEGTPITIPYLDMLTTLAVSIVPLIIGILATRFLPKVGKVMVKAIVPIALIFMAFVLTFGMYANFYIFEVIGREPRVWVVVLLPFGGLLLAGLAALAVRESRPSCITVAIETSIQSTGTAIILLRLSLQQPWSDMSLCVPILMSMFTPLPLIALYAGKLIATKLRQRHGERLQDGDISNTAKSNDAFDSQAEAEEPDLSNFDATDDKIVLATSSGLSTPPVVPCYMSSV